MQYNKEIQQLTLLIDKTLQQEPSAKALKDWKRAIKLSEKLHGRKHEITLLCITGMGDCYQHINMLNEAIIYHKQAIELSEELFGPIYSETHKSLMQLACCLLFLQRHEEELPVRQRLLENAEKMNDAISTIVCGEFLADCLCNLGHFSEAIQCIQQIIERFTATDIPTGITEIMLKRKLEPCRKAIAAGLDRQRIPAEKEATTPKPPDNELRVTTLHRDLIRILSLEKLGHHEDAFVCWQKLELRRRGLKIGELPKHCSELLIPACQAIGRSLNTMQCFSDEALAFWKEAKEVSEEVGGPANIATFICAWSAVLCLLQQQRYEEALAGLTELVELAFSCFGKEHPKSIECMFSKGQCLIKLGHYTEALPILEETLKYCVSIPGIDPHMTIACKRLLSVCNDPNPHGAMN